MLAVLTSTLNGCSSPLTAHKIHSNHCKHNVPTQQLLRHLLPRTAKKTIVKSALSSLIVTEHLFTVGASERTRINPTRLAVTSFRESDLRCWKQGRGAGDGERRRRFVDRPRLPRIQEEDFPRESLAVNACQRPFAGPAVPGWALRYTDRCSKWTRPAPFLRRAA